MLIKARNLLLSVLLVVAVGGLPSGRTAGADLQRLPASSLAVGDRAGCVANTAGNVGCWGTTNDGPLVPPDVTFTSVSVASYHACGLRSDATLACWGDWLAGVNRVPSGTFTSVDVGGADKSCGTTTSGSIVCWNYYGDDPFGEAAPYGDFASVSVGATHACAIRTTGAIACWGDDSTGAAPTDVTGSFTTVSAGGGFTCALATDGALSCWGRSFADGDYSGTYSSVSAGQDHVCALRIDGTIGCWGSDFDGQIFAPAGRYTLVAAGSMYSCAARDDLQVVCWGAARHPYYLPAMQSGPVPAAIVDRPYSWRFYGIGQSPSQRFTIVDGTLPPGLTLSADGSLTGTPAEIGRWHASVSATNDLGPDYTQSFDLVVNPLPVLRLSGADRYATSAAISRDTWSGPPLRAYIATGSAFPDALSVAAAAGGSLQTGPVLLVQRDAIPRSVADELQRLRPYRITIVGGAGAVSAGVEQALHRYATTGEVERTAGADRYATSAAIAARFFSPGVKRVFVATGEAFPDALAGASAAGYWSSPLLLVRSGSIPSSVAAELQRLRPASIYLLGGTGAVSVQVEQQLASYSTKVVRLAGSDRYATSAAISAASFVAGAKRAYVATGTGFADAVSGAAAAGVRDSPLLLVPSKQITDPVRRELSRLRPQLGYVLGGTSAISLAVESAFADFVAR